jgi:3-oxoacyl-[acyl-carrier protein] reductase
VDLTLSGRTALVTGGSSGLGLAAARALAAEGVRLCLCARDAARLEAARRELLAAGSPGVTVLAADIDDAAARAGMLEGACAALGGLDVLVANSGNPRGGWVDGLADADWSDATAKMRAIVELDRFAARVMAESGGGAIVNVLSRTAVEPDPGLALSSVVRSALLAWGKMLADRVGPSGVRVVSVLPGLTRTAGVEAHLREAAPRSDGAVRADDALAADEAARIGVPLRRLGTTGSFGRLVAFLASPACDYVSGSAVRFDGGGVRAP